MYLIFTKGLILDLKRVENFGKVSCHLLTCSFNVLLLFIAITFASTSNQQFSALTHHRMEPSLPFRPFSSTIARFRSLQTSRVSLFAQSLQAISRLEANLASSARLPEPSYACHNPGQRYLCARQKVH